MSNIRRTAAFTPEMGAQAIEEAVTGSSEFRKFKTGDNFIRFFPAVLSDSWQEGDVVPKPYRLIYQHFLKNLPGASGPVVFLCPRLGPTKRTCPACDHCFKLASSGNPAHRDEAKEIWEPRQQALWIGLDRENEHLGPGLYSLSPKTHKKLCAYTDQRKGGDFLDPVQGFDFIVTKTEKGEFPEYDVVPSRQSSHLRETEEEINQDLDTMPNLDKHTVIWSDEDILDKIGQYLTMPSPAQPLQAPAPRQALSAPVNRPVASVPRTPVQAPPARPRVVPPPPPAPKKGPTAQDMVHEMTENENGEWGLSDKEKA